MKGDAQPLIKFFDGSIKINILHGMFDECNIPASGLVFEFRSDQEGEDEE